MTKKLYGVTPEGKDVYRYILSNKNGMEIALLNFGAILESVIVPDKNGNKKDVVLACDSLDTFRENNCYLGSVIAPSANRIAKAEVPIDGVVYKMEVNDRENNLHTHFTNGMNKRIWNAEEIEKGIRFTFELEDMEYGLPGKRDLSVVYTLTDENEIRMEYECKSDRNTLFNVTNHSYFNLDGHTSNTILNQKLQLKASNYTPIKEGLLTIGTIESVKGTPLDFTEWKTIGREIDADYEQLKIAGGYDHTFVMDDYDGTVKEIARAKSEETGIVLSVFTDMPGVHFYAGNYIDGEKGKEGMVYGKCSGFCLETQYYPDSVHHAHFPSVVFGPNRPFRSTTIFKFGV